MDGLMLLQQRWVNMELIFALGRYLDGRNVFSKIPITIVMSLLTLYINPVLLISVILAYTIGIGKFNSAYDGNSYDFKDRTLYIFDFIPNFIARYNKRLGGIVGVSLRYFLPFALFLYFSYLPLLLLLCGPVYALSGIIDKHNDMKNLRDEGDRGIMGLEMPEIVCGYLIGAVIVGLPIVNLFNLIGV